MSRWNHWRLTGLPVLLLLILGLGGTIMTAACSTGSNDLPSENKTAENTPASTREPAATESIPQPTEAATPAPTPTPGETTATAPTSTTAPTPTAAPTHAAPLRVLIPDIPEALTAPYESYDTERSLAELVKPHFYARSAGGEPVPARGTPELVLEVEGRVKVRLRDGNQESFLDLLALESQLLGEHPVHKIFRLAARGIPVDPALAQRLRDPNGSADLFQNVEFQYLPDHSTRGVIAEVFPDGTFLVIPFGTPEEWQSERPSVASPSHLHVNPRALSAATSTLAQEYETEILSLPFNDQRYPPAPLAERQCRVYQESVGSETYRGILDAVGFRFTPEPLLEGEEGDSDSFGARLARVLGGGAGEGVRYFGYERDWITERLLQLEVSWIDECDAAGGIRRYQTDDDPTDRYYTIIRRSLEPDPTRRYRLALLDDAGNLEEVYTAPGIMLMAQPLPSNDRRWLLSTEGWPGPEGEAPPDPRWQAVYLVDLDRPGEYQKVHYPIDQFPRAPEAGLYGVSPRLTDDRRYLFNTLYGFKDEGGGIWVVDLSAEDFPSRPDLYTRIVSWDHTLSWTVLGDQTDDAGHHLNVFMTGKEVADDFAMTANILRIQDAGLDSAIERQERLLQMVGWNPVPFGWQKLSENRYRVAVETHFNYESSLLPRAKGVYFVPLDTTP